jgi:hypothetical protein
MIAAKTAFTILILAGLIPLILAPAHADLRPRNWRRYDWYDWAVIISCVVMLLSAAAMVLAFVWGI